MTGKVLAWKIGTGGVSGPSSPSTAQRAGDVTQPSTMAAGHAEFDQRHSKLVPAATPHDGSKIHFNGVVNCSTRSSAPIVNMTLGRKTTEKIHLGRLLPGKPTSAVGMTIPSTFLIRLAS